MAGLWCSERLDFCCQMAEEDLRHIAALYERFMKLQQPYSDIIAWDQ